MTGVQTCALTICFPVTIPRLEADGSQAVIAGKGVGSQSDHTLSFDCGAEHQVIMCVYHAVPLVDWNLTGQNPQLTVSPITDFPQPAFDQLGMQAVPALNLHNNPSRSVPSSIGYTFGTGNGSLILILFMPRSVLVWLISLGSPLLMAGMS